MRYTLVLLSLSFALAGCGSGEPEHPVKPIASVPPATTDFSRFTPEEKIKYIENSKAPDSEKQKAIAQVKAGKL
ncbi:MAG: hypothetical protein BGO01_10605 [Armatimonadetes bacterium 55-13]|nr:hypothetical protein [Armatimonadota bacterium]OJU62847.1 MAG: hypothetical protein BGO01_10605 [Armatimonadetes bacterium 55-13]